MSEASSLAKRLGRPSLWVALCSAVAVMAMAVVDTGRSSPGPLASVHSRVPELAGANDCSACHGGWFQDMAAACLDCHTPIEKQLDSGQGLHGQLPEEQRRCASCHSDHHGAGFAMVNELSFAKAGVDDIQAFDHASIGFRMEGAHLELDCTECHAHAQDEVLPEGATRFIGLSQRCVSCHEDEHDGALGRTCNDCHVQASFEQHWSRGHDEHLKLVGGHGGLSCRDCHGEGDDHALEVVAGGGSLPDARACTDCHDSPHGAGFAVGNARLAGLGLARSCDTCHASEHRSFRDEGLELSDAQHGLSGFPLEAPHADVTCAQCHEPHLDGFAQRYPGRERDACAACHADPHGGQFESGPFAAEGCVACHGRERFEPHGFDTALHARTSLPLEGSHLATDCEQCHVAAEPDLPRLFRGTDNDCDACHGDAHSGFFDLRTAALAPLEHGDCARCHRATEFSDLDRDGFEHGRWTGFPVAGAHAAEGCDSCHRPSSQADELGRHFGRVEPAHGELPTLHGGAEVGQSCAACHADPHEGRFDQAGLPALFDERQGCARCHVDSSFRDLAHGFDHGLWTGFKLDGAHGQASCTQCHAPLRPPTESGRTWRPAAGKACADCHDDPHAAQFEQAGSIDCARCHGSTKSFAALRFNHDWDSSFKLDETHEALDCAQCHRTEQIRGTTAIRYKPLGTACTDCHGVRATSLRRGASEDR
ncbi:cytochrome c3 family protein [Engelhardtia mirabilis]|uniref:Cytochrome c7-like domain-containing protein n=1 Tax=Engelhardtia mirabilis TaxID=2528011 RepID=A0A518BN62_9BACT|nr:hypothetical protein Pla133_35170 [Planctomycetes bacterium Pla133]QDV02745.1 hypothetical protein Pla86_35150 [Planctomycetes bacterium Pla86]